MFDLKKLLQNGALKPVTPTKNVATIPPPQPKAPPAQAPNPFVDAFNAAGGFAKGINEATFGQFNKNVFQPYVVQPTVNAADSLGKGFGYAFGGGMDANLNASNQAYNNLKTLHDQFKTGKLKQQNYATAARQSAALQTSLIPTATDISSQVDPVKQAANTASLGLTAASLLDIPAGATNLVTNTLGRQVVRSLVQGVPIGAAFGALNELQQQGRNASPLGVAASAGEGGAFGGALSAAGPLISKAGSKLIQFARDAQKGVATDLAINKPVTSLPTNQLVSHEATDPARVNFYKQQIQNGQPVEPLIAIRDNQGILGVEDGKHRLQAYKDLGINNVPTRIVTHDELKQALQGGFAQIPGRAPKITASNAPATNEVAQAEALIRQKVEHAARNGRTFTTPEDIARQFPEEVKAYQQAVNRANQPAAVEQPKPTVPEPTVTLPEPPHAPKPASAPTRAGFKPNRLTERAQTSPEVAAETQQLLREANPTYRVRSTAKLAERSDKFVGGQPLDSATENVKNRMAVPKGKLDDNTVADAIAVAKANDAAGNHQAATEVYTNLAQHLTKSGQTIQAASLLSNRTPEGIKFQATRDFNKAGVKPDSELQGQLDAAYNKLAGTKEGTKERVGAAQEYAKIVADNLPQSFVDKALSFWKAGLLTGIRTQTGNAESNLTFGVLHGASNPLASAIDKGIGLFTGRRTKTFTTKGYASGTAEGFGKALTYLKTGVDERQAMASKFESGGPTFHSQRGEINFGKSPAGKVASTYVNGVFRLMGAADRPAYYAQLRNSLADLAKADGANLKLKGAELDAHIKNFVENPPEAAFRTATDEAEKAVLGNETFLSHLAGSMRQAAERIKNPAGRGLAKAGLGIIAPFTKVPSAYVNRVLDFTPIGAVKSAVGQIAAGKFDQRALATALSEATTGTAIIYLGMKLADNNQISGDYPNDPKEQARWKAQGIQPNSLKVGNDWLSTNYLGPVGALFNAGKRINDAMKTGDATQVATSATAGIAQDALNQSFLQGVSGILDAVNDPQRYAANYLKTQASSAVPTISNDLAQALDKWQRDANNVGEAIQSRIPGLREVLRIKQDVYGNKLDAKTDPGNTLINPLRPSKARTNDVLSEVERLHNVDPNNKDLQVTPTPINKSVNFDGVPTALTDQQRYDLQEQIGQKTQSLWSDLIKTPEYHKLDDAGKAKALGNLRQDATAVVMKDFAAKNSLGQYSQDFQGKAKKLSANQLRLQTSPDLARYTKQASGVSPAADYNASPDAEYKAAVDAYNKAKADGKLNDIQNVKRQQQLVRLKVGSSYDKSLRDLYGMSHQQIYDYVSTNPNGKELASKLKEYDQKLYNAGVISKPKFKTGIRPKVAKAKVKRGKYSLAGGLRTASSSRSALRNLVLKASR